MGQFDWFLKIGATPQAVAVLNDQPYLFTVLLIVLGVISFQIGIIVFIHFATMKPEQKKKKTKGGNKKAPGPNDRRAAGAPAPGGGGGGGEKGGKLSKP